MASMYDIKRKIAAETGVVLVAAAPSDRYTVQPSVLQIGHHPNRDYYCELIGPYLDADNPDVRVFIEHRRVDGTETVTLLVQDATDDAILNSTADGIEKYRAGWPFQL
jgi:hypothetical protein